MIDFKHVLAANINTDFDFNLISQEIINCKSNWIETPIWQNWIDMAESGQFFKVETDEMYNKISRSYKDATGKEIRDKRELDGFYNIYLRAPEEEAEFKNKSFNRTKYLTHSDWRWRPSLAGKLPYTIKCIESLPYKSIGLVRVFITKNTFFPTHYDYDYNLDTVNESGVDDLTKTLGISLIPSTGDVPLKIWSNIDNSVKTVHGNSMIFRDSQPHGVPYTPGIRITIRIFGEIDFDALEKYIDKSSIVQ
jgi:hypothetical protein